MSKLIIDSNNNTKFIDVHEIIKYKDLFYTLTLREFKVRYSQSVLGFAWAFIQPLFTLVVLNLVFGRFVKVDTGTTPHILFTVCGTTFWTFFSYTVTNAGSSFISNQNLVKKVYFPRIIIPITKSFVGLIDLIISLIFVFILLIYFKTTIQINIVISPLIILWGLITALAFGILISALSIRYRDFQYVVPFFVQFGLYITPIAYPSEFVIKTLSPWAQYFYYLNPMAGIIECFRWSILNTPVHFTHVLVSLASTILVVIMCLFVFRKVENQISDFV